MTMALRTRPPSSQPHEVDQAAFCRRERRRNHTAAAASVSPLTAAATVATS